MFWKKAVTLGCVLSLSVALAGCGTKTKTESNSGAENLGKIMDEPQVSPTDEEISQLAEPKKGETVATFHIKDYGDVKVHFFESAAPKAVANFTALANAGYYDGVTFHRVIEDFMIQGGDPQGTGMGGTSAWGSDFEDEISKYLIPLRGALCMANVGDGHSNGSQFFIVQEESVESTDKQQVKQMLDSYIQSYKSKTGLTLDAYDDSVIDNYLKVGGSLYLSGGYTVFGQVYEGMDVVDAIAVTDKNGDEKPDTDVIIDSIDISTY